MIEAGRSAVLPSLEARLAELEQVASVLEEPAPVRAERLRAVAAYVESYLDGVEDRPVYQFDPEHDAAPPSLRFSEQAQPLAQVLDTYAGHVDASGANIVSPRFFGFIPSGGLYSSALGDFLAAATNRYAGAKFSAPGLTRLERSVVRWFADLAGYPEGAEGDLTSGGSVAALSAIVAAREAHGLRARDFERAVVYVSPLSHHTILKALRVAGLTEAVVREVPIDAAYRMDAGALERAVTADHGAGLAPWLVIATAGTTDMGSIDPLPLIADICARNHLWMHVDGAYGGAFLLSETGRPRLAGVERSDSFVVDPHKGLFLPFGCGVVIVRDGQRLLDAFHARGPYMQDFKHVFPVDDRSAADVSPELSRPFRGLRVWLPLKLFGVATFRAALEEKLLLARYFHEQVQRLDGVEVGPPPDLSVVTFRFLPARGDANELNRRLVDALRNDGRIFLSSTSLRGTYLLRFAVLGFNTHRDDVDLALEVLAHKAGELRRRA
ncbi:MAG: aminotransferase class V-fold PLP-dependent enzyme [Gammaproteobacteria bacterium]|nr:aminotransferase class V-fold PLP-dependent enzyme [Gammaproteobacteria bacterium]